MRTRALMAAALMAAMAAAAAAHDGASQPAAKGQIVMEYVGQVVNGIPTPAGSQRSGNLLSVAGTDPSDWFTFYTDAATTAVVANGPLRIIERAGTTTVYLAPAAGTFDNPDSFRAGVPVQVSSLRQQVIVDTSNGLFTVINLNTVTDSQPFRSNGADMLLGTKGRTFRTRLTGQLNAPGASPTGWFGGYATWE